MVAEIVDGRVVTKVYCKTDHFPFEVISLPFLDSNLDDRICYRVFYGQVIRFQRLSSSLQDFESRVKFLADILLKRDYEFRLLQRQFCRAVDKYILEFQKWAISLELRSWFANIVRSD